MRIAVNAVGQRAAAVFLSALLAAASAGAAAPRTGVVLDETVSALHPVVEDDWLELLQSRAREADALGLFEKRRREQQEMLRRHAERPVDVMLPRASRSETVQRVLFEARRTQMLPAAAREVVSRFERTYLFVDGDDPAQRRWLAASLRRLAAGGPGALSGLRIVAVGGSLPELSRYLKEHAGGPEIPETASQRRCADGPPRLGRPGRGARAALRRQGASGKRPASCREDPGTGAGAGCRAGAPDASDPGAWGRASGRAPKP